MLQRTIFGLYRVQYSTVQYSTVQHTCACPPALTALARTFPRPSAHSPHGIMRRRIHPSLQAPCPRTRAAARFAGAPHRDWAHPTAVTSALGLGSPLHICTRTGLTSPHLHWDWAHPTAATSALGLGSPLHICAGSGLTPATSAPGLGSPCHICTGAGLTLPHKSRRTLCSCMALAQLPGCCVVLRLSAAGAARCSGAACAGCGATLASASCAGESSASQTVFTRRAFCDFVRVCARARVCVCACVCVHALVRVSLRRCVSLSLRASGIPSHSAVRGGSALPGTALRRGLAQALTKGEVCLFWYGASPCRAARATMHRLTARRRSVVARGARDVAMPLRRAMQRSRRRVAALQRRLHLLHRAATG